MLEYKVNIPTEIFYQEDSLKAKYVSCGSNYTMLIDMNDDVWAFRSNQNGELGLGDYQSRNIPTKLPNIKAQFVSCGGNHTPIIDLANDIWAFGFGPEGQLGLPNVYQSRNIPTQIPGIKGNFLLVEIVIQR